MQLTQSERIQILRKRAGINQGTLGERAFATTFESGRTKIKNIELGRQIPTSADVKKIAGALEVKEELLWTESGGGDSPLAGGGKGILILQKTLDLFPGLGLYVDMLNKAVKIDDEELIRYISDKMAGLLAGRSSEAGAVLS